jgi:hypothetical protein
MMANTEPLDEISTGGEEYKLNMRLRGPAHRVVERLEQQVQQRIVLRKARGVAGQSLETRQGDTEYDDRKASNWGAKAVPSLTTF